MFPSLYAVSSCARHVIQLFFFLSLQLLFLLSSFGHKTVAKSNPKKKRSVIYFFFLHNILERYNTTQCNALQAYGTAARQKRRYAMFCSCLSCPSYASLHGVLERYSAMQYNAIQSNGTGEQEKKRLKRNIALNDQ